MVRLKLLLVGAAAIGLLMPALSTNSPVAQAATGGCAKELVSAGLCDPPEANGAINGGGVDVSAGIESGSSGSDGTGNEGSGTDDSSNDGDEILVGDTGAVVGPDAIDRPGYIVNCIPNSPCDPNFSVSINDLVNFTPAAASTQMEPSGWMVVGLPTNFIADASTHVRSGMLLGFAAEVRFTPAAYGWNFGDSTISRVASGGSTWNALGLTEFSDTSTSHRYAASGTFVITTTVDYTVEYRFAGQAWRTISGVVAATAEPFTAVAGQAKTVLVNNGCQADSRGPGC